MATVLFVDGENFKKKCQESLRNLGFKKVDWQKFDFSGLLDKVLSGVSIDEKLFYAAKMIKHPRTLKKSEILIQQQRLLKQHLEGQGFEFIISGRVRGHEEKDSVTGKNILSFKEKGVDVRIAVDLVSRACDGNLDLAVLASSDSDLQPAIKEVRRREKEILYLGFEQSPNKGMTYTTNRTILIRNSEIKDFYQGAK